jgi:hypothetical protein
MKTIWKYEFDIADQVTLMIPPGHTKLHWGRQNPDKICLWALVDSSLIDEPNHFTVVGTGHDLSLSQNEMTYLASVQDGPFVWHVFEGHLI